MRVFASFRPTRLLVISPHGSKSRASQHAAILTHRTPVPLPPETPITKASDFTVQDTVTNMKYFELRPK